MNKFLRLITPNKKADKQTTLIIIGVWLVCTFLLWSTSKTHYLPTPGAILDATKNLFAHQDLMSHLVTSTWLCLKAIFYSIVISLIISLFSVLPAFKPFTSFSSKARFLSTVGLTFIFAQLAPDTNSLKVILLVFCITVFLATSFLSIVMEVKKEELDYARTLKMNEWETLWEVIILGKADQFLEAIKQNFAIAWIMLAMVENLCRAEGGIGVILFQENKLFHLDSVYAIQIIVLFLGIFLDWALGIVRQIFCPYSVSINHK